jgi:uncharacterized protein (PEP-CTERM system associated)
LAASAHAEQWRFEPWLGVEETFTNNVNLQPNAARRGDWVSQLTPGFRVRETGAHTSLLGYVSLPILLYARTGGENNRVDPQISLLGNWEVAERFFFVESAIDVNQQYLSPFGPRSESLANATNNRYTSQTYRVTPYLKGETSDYSYELRDNNIWTKGNASIVNDAYVNELVGTFQRDPRPLGVAFDVDRSDTKFQDQQRQLLELVRTRGLYQVDPQLQFFASVGYEHNDLLLESTSDTIYGVGLKWRPTERSNVDASWEHRFFGASYNVAFSNRTPLSVWNISASRNITTYPQQLAAIPANVSVVSVLNQLFLTRIPDTVQRQALVNQLILDRGLPTFLTSGINIYNQQVTLQELATATAGLLGARNNVFATVYRLRQEPITGSGNVAPSLAALTDNTQYGANLVWSHNLTPILTLTASVDASRTTDNAPGGGKSKQSSVHAGLTSPLSAQTDVYGGIRYQIFRSDVNFDYDEFALFVGLNHRFH